MTDEPDLTTLRARRAAGGSASDLDWVIGRFSPLLVLQARFRLGARLQTLYEPEDLVHEVWATVLPRLAELESRAIRFTPALLKFLSTTLLHLVNNLLRKHIVARDERGANASELLAGLSTLPGDTANVVTAAVRRELEGLAMSVLDELSEGDRNVICLRALEQLSNKEVADLLGLQPNTAAVRYKRALGRLRGRLPDSVFEEVPDE